MAEAGRQASEAGNKAILLQQEISKLQARRPPALLTWIN
jgi:hypothetical protein